MNNAILIQELTKFANQDLALARKNRKITVAQTKLGNLDVEFAAGAYTVSATGTVLAVGPAKVARAFLIATYDVVQG